MIFVKHLPGYRWAHRALFWFDWTRYRLVVEIENRFNKNMMQVLIVCEIFIRDFTQPCFTDALKFNEFSLPADPINNSEFSSKLPFEFSREFFSSPPMREQYNWLGRLKATQQDIQDDLVKADDVWKDRLNCIIIIHDGQNMLSNMVKEGLKFSSFTMVEYEGQVFQESSSRVSGSTNAQSQLPLTNFPELPEVRSDYYQDFYNLSDAEKLMEKNYVHPPVKVISQKDLYLNDDSTRRSQHWVNADAATKLYYKNLHTVKKRIYDVMCIRWGSIYISMSVSLFMIFLKLIWTIRIQPRFLIDSNSNSYFKNIVWFKVCDLKHDCVISHTEHWESWLLINFTKTTTFRTNFSKSQNPCFFVHKIMNNSSHEPEVRPMDDYSYRMVMCSEHQKLLVYLQKLCFDKMISSGQLRTEDDCFNAEYEKTVKKRIIKEKWVFWVKTGQNFKNSI